MEDIEKLIEQIVLSEDSDVFQEQLKITAQAAVQHYMGLKNALVKLRDISEKASKYGSLNPKIAHDVSQALDYVYSLKKLLQSF